MKIRQKMRNSENTVVFKWFFDIVFWKNGEKCISKGKVLVLYYEYEISKASACLNHELHNYLSDSKTRLKIENILSTWMEVVFGVS